MNIKSNNSSLSDKMDMDHPLVEEVNGNTKVKLMDNHKLELNEAFGKLGNMSNQSSLNESDNRDEKVPVMDLLARGYSEDMMFDYHRPCNCTKSYCLKLYCECFARDKLCFNCNCNNCMNNLDHEKSRSTALLRILDKNPLAFVPKIGSGQGHKLHRKGCNCKRSECLKNYCECREAKIECSLLCRCQGCKNRNNEVNSQIAHIPCSLDMASVDPGGFKSSNTSFKSKSELVNDKCKEGVDLNFPFRPVYDDSYLHSNGYCNNANMSDFSPGVSYPPSTNPMNDMVKYSEFCKKMNEDFYKQNPIIFQSDDHASNAKQFQLLNWNPFINVSNESTDYKHGPYNNPYPTMDASKFPNSQQQCSIPLPVISSNLDASRIVPSTSVQYFSDPDEFLDQPSANYYKSYNPLPNARRFHNPDQYNYSVRGGSQSFDVQSSVNDDQDENAEVTSTNEMGVDAMMECNHCDSLSQHQALSCNSTVKPPQSGSQSPRFLVPNPNYNCFPFSSDTLFQDNRTSSSKSDFQLKYSTQNGNDRVLPSLFNNMCEANDVGAHTPFFRPGIINQPMMIAGQSNSSSDLLQKKSAGGEDADTNAMHRSYGNRNDSSFFNYYETEPPFLANLGAVDHENTLQKTEPVLEGGLCQGPSYPDNFNPFFYHRSNDIHSKVVISSNNVHQ